MNLYEMLGIAPSADEETIRQVIAKQSSEWNKRKSMAISLDKRREAEDTVTAIAEARRVLLDVEKRRVYDQEILITDAHKPLRPGAMKDQEEGLSLERLKLQLEIEKVRAERERLATEREHLEQERLKIDGVKAEFGKVAQWAKENIASTAQNYMPQPDSHHVDRRESLSTSQWAREAINRAELSDSPPIKAASFGTAVPARQFGKAGFKSGFKSGFKGGFGSCVILGGILGLALAHYSLPSLTDSEMISSALAVALFIIFIGIFAGLCAGILGGIVGSLGGKTR